MKTSTVITAGFSRLAIDARVGVDQHEYSAPQRIFVSLTMEYPSGSDFERSDLREDALDYSRAADIVRSVCAEKHHGLLEHLATRIAGALRKEFPSCARICLSIAKPAAIPDAEEATCTFAWSKGRAGGHRA